MSNRTRSSVLAVQETLGRLWSTGYGLRGQGCCGGDNSSTARKFRPSSLKVQCTCNGRQAAKAVVVLFIIVVSVLHVIPAPGDMSDSCTLCAFVCESVHFRREKSPQEGQTKARERANSHRAVCTTCVQSRRGVLSRLLWCKLPNALKLGCGVLKISRDGTVLPFEGARPEQRQRLPANASQVCVGRFTRFRFRVPYGQEGTQDTASTSYAYRLTGPRFSRPSCCRRVSTYSAVRRIRRD